MTTIAELIAAAPDPAAGYATQFVDGPGTWRVCVLLADPAAGASVEWHDVTGRCAGVTNEWGADEYGGDARAGVTTITLTAPDDRFAPTNEDTSTTFGTHVQLGPGLLVRGGYFRVSGGVVVETRWRFTRRVETWTDETIAAGAIRRHVITARDLMTDLVMEPVSSQPAEPWRDRADAVLSSWPYGVAAYGAETWDDAGTPTPVLVLPDRAEAASAIVELDATLQPVGLLWHVRPDGVLQWRPRPEDTFHAGFHELAGTTGTEWTEPQPIVFSYQAADDGGVPFIREPQDGTPGFGFDATELAIVNHLVVTDPVGPAFDDDDPVSIQRHGWRRRAFTWIAKNDTVAADYLAARKFATLQARPIVTDHRRSGFFGQVLRLDWLHPLEVRHRTAPGRIPVHATGRVRSITESWRPLPGYTWHRVQIVADVDATSEQAELLAPTSLAAGSITDQEVLLSWSNPTQPIAPTATQIRVDAGVWLTMGYPITSLAWIGLQPNTTYQADVRYVREVDDVITHVSPQANVEFSTLEGVTVGGDDTDTIVDLPAPDPGCEVQWELQESDDVWPRVWTTVASGTAASGGEVTLPASSFEDHHVYRIESVEVCGGTPGDPIYSGVFDPPDTWTDPCTTPPALADAPFDDAVLYVPKVCAPATITEAVSGTAGATGWAYAGLYALQTDADYIALASGDTAGIVAYGAASQVEALTGEQSIFARFLFGTDEVVDQLVRVGRMKLEVLEVSSERRLAATVNFQGGTITAIGPDALVEGEVYRVGASYDPATATVALIVDGVEVATGSDALVAGFPVTPLPAWIASAPADSWITDVAAWDRVVAASELPAPVFPVELSGGTVTEPGDGYRYHRFTTNGTLTVIHGGEVEYLVVGGGGAGGGGIGGGGGGGEVATGTITISTAQSITIGAGGAPAGGWNDGGNGGASSLGSLVTAAGGAGGGGRARPGKAGASGGGGGGASGAGGAGSVGGNGGNGISAGNYGGGGGGGAGGGNGANATTTKAGSGGAGVTVWGTSYGAGGGAGTGAGTLTNVGDEGGTSAGSGGTSTAGSAESAPANRGGGGGGTGANATYNAGAGGSGVVIVRYPI